MGSKLLWFKTTIWLFAIFQVWIPFQKHSLVYANFTSFLSDPLAVTQSPSQNHLNSLYTTPVTITSCEDDPTCDKTPATTTQLFSLLRRRTRSSRTGTLVALGHLFLADKVEQTSNNLEPLFSISSIYPYFETDFNCTRDCKIPLLNDDAIYISFNLPVVDSQVPNGQTLVRPADKRPVFVNSTVDSNEEGFIGHWISDSTYRLTPRKSWPSNSIIVLEFNPNLRSFSNQLIHKDKKYFSSPIYFTVQPSSIHICDVVSEKASTLTSGKWKSFFMHTNDTTPVGNAHEIPPDGKIYVEFSDPIDVDFHIAQKELNKRILSVVDITDPNKLNYLDKTVKLSRCIEDRQSCSKESNRCLLLSFDTPLQTNHLYSIQLRPDASYFTKVQSYMVENLEKSNKNFNIITGLKPFKLWPSKTNYEPIVGHNTIRVFLPHGLCHYTSGASIQSVMELKEIDLHYTNVVEINTVVHDKNSSSLLITALNLVSPGSYELHIRESPFILDGFELNIQETVIPFTFKSLNNVVIYPGSFSPILRLSQPANSDLDNLLETNEDHKMYSSVSRKLLHYQFPILYNPFYGYGDWKVSGFNSSIIPLVLEPFNDLLTFAEALYLSFAANTRDKEKFLKPYKAAVSVDCFKPYNDDRMPPILARKYSQESIHLPLSLYSGTAYLLTMKKHQTINGSLETDFKSHILLANSSSVITYSVVTPKNPMLFGSDPKYDIKVNVLVSSLIDSLDPIANEFVRLYQIDRWDPTTLEEIKKNQTDITNKASVLAEGRTNSKGLITFTVNRTVAIRNKYLKNLLETDSALSLSETLLSLYGQPLWCLGAFNDKGMVTLSDPFDSPIKIQKLIKTRQASDESSCVTINETRLCDNETITQWATDRSFFLPGEEFAVVGLSVVKQFSSLENPEKMNRTRIAETSYTKSVKTYFNNSIRTLMLLTFQFRQPAEFVYPGLNPSICILVPSEINEDGMYSSTGTIPSEARSGKLYDVSSSIAIINSDIPDAELNLAMQLISNDVARSRVRCRNFEDLQKLLEKYLKSYYLATLNLPFSRTTMYSNQAIFNHRSPTLKLTLNSKNIVSPKDSLVVSTTIENSDANLPYAPELTFSLKIPVILNQEVLPSGNKKIRLSSYTTFDPRTQTLEQTSVQESYDSNIFDLTFYPYDMLSDVKAVYPNAQLNPNTPGTLLLETIGNSGETIELSKSITITASGYTLKPPIVTPFMHSGQLIKLHAEAYGTPGTENYIRPNLVSILYEIYAVSTKSEKQSQDCSDYLALPIDGDSWIQSAFRNKSTSNSELSLVSTCEGLKRNNYECFFLTGEYEKYIVVAEASLNSTVTHDIVSITSCKLVEKRFPEFASYEQRNKLTSFGIDTNKKLYTANSKAPITLEFTNPFIGYFPYTNQIQEGILFYSYNFLSEISNATEVTMDARKISFSDSFRQIKKLEDGLVPLSSNFDLYDATRVTVDIGPLPDQCNPPGCKIFVSVALQPNITSDKLLETDLFQPPRLLTYHNSREVLYVEEEVTIPVTIEPSVTLEKVEEAFKSKQEMDIDVKINYTPFIGANDISIYPPGTEVNVTITARLAKDLGLLPTSRGTAYIIAVDESYLEKQKIHNFDFDHSHSIVTEFIEYILNKKENSVYNNKSPNGSTGFQTLSVETIQRLTKFLISRWEKSPTFDVKYSDLLSIFYHNKLARMNPSEFLNFIVANITTSPDEYTPNSLLEQELLFQQWNADFENTIDRSNSLTRKTQSIKTPYLLPVLKSEGKPLGIFEKVELKHSTNSSDLSGTVTIKIPEHPGQYNLKIISSALLDVLAHDNVSQYQRSAFGFTSTRFESKALIYLKPYLPPFVRPLEEIQIGVQIFADSSYVNQETLLELQLSISLNGTAPLILHPQQPWSKLDQRVVRTIIFWKSRPQKTQLIGFSVSSGRVLGPSIITFTVKRDDIVISTVSRTIEILPATPIIAVNAVSLLSKKGNIDDRSWAQSSKILNLSSFVPEYGSLNISASTGFTEAIVSMIHRRISTDFLPADWLAVRKLSSIHDRNHIVNKKHVAETVNELDFLEGQLSETFFAFKEFSVPLDTLLLTLRGELQLCSRYIPAADSRVEVIRKAAHVSRTVLELYFPTVDNKNQPILTGPVKYPVSNIKLHQTESDPTRKTNHLTNTNIIETVFAISTLKQYINSEAILEKCQPSSSNLKPFIKTAKILVNRLDTYLSTLLQSTYEEYLVLKKVSINGSSKFINFISYMGQSNWAILEHYLTDSETTYKDVIQNERLQQELTFDNFLQVEKSRVTIVDCEITETNLYVSLSILKTITQKKKILPSLNAVQFAKACVNGAMDNLKKISPTIYIDVIPSSAIDDVQSLLLQAIYLSSNIENFNQTAAGLALYLAQGGIGYEYGFLGGLPSRTIASIVDALSVYDSKEFPESFLYFSQTSNQQTSHELTINKNLFSESFGLLSSYGILLHATTKGPSSVSNSSRWDGIINKLGLNKYLIHDVSETKVQSQLLMKDIGKAVITISGSVSQDIINIDPVYNGILIEKKFKNWNSHSGRCDFSSTLQPETGRLICVILLITVKEPILNMVVKDSLISGFDTINPKKIRSLHYDTLSTGPVPYKVNICGEPDINESEGDIQWLCSIKSPGTYELMYFAVTKFAGSFALPTATAYDRSNPNKMGMSGGSVGSLILNHSKRILQTSMTLQQFNRQLTPNPFVNFGTSPRLSCGECDRQQTCNPITRQCANSISINMERQLRSS